MRILKNRRNRKPAEKWPITIYYDDREKKGRWQLHCAKFGMVKKRLKTGDYAFKGFESLFCVERKAHLTEFIANISGQKKYKLKLYLERLGQFPMKCIVVEESLEHLGKVLATSRGQLQEKDVNYWISKIMFEYSIPIIFCSSKGQSKQAFLFSLFDCAWRSIQ